MSATALPASCRRIRWSRVISSGNLGADQEADGQRDHDHGRDVEPEPGERHVQHQHRQSADQREHSLHEGEGADRAAAQRLGGEGAEPMAKTITEMTTEVCSTELPMR